jgi:SAM-dependent methyltransferase
MPNLDSRGDTQLAYWDGVGGQHWVRRQEAWDIVLEPVALAAIDRARVESGERIVDIGCGCGATTLMLAERVGSGGHVLGIDVSHSMLARAKARTSSALPVEWALADAANYPFDATYDLLFSRFGVMFFAEPVRAFANLQSALRPGGRLAFACIRTPKENPWMLLPLQAAYRHVPPLPQPGPDEPGPFSLADPVRLERTLTEAGFADLRLEPLDLELDVASGGGLETAVESLLVIGAASRAVEGATPQVREAVAGSLREVLGPYCRGDAVCFPAAIWLVTGRNAAV